MTNLDKFKKDRAQTKRDRKNQTRLQTWTGLRTK